MNTTSLTPLTAPKIEKLVEVYRASLIRANPTSPQLQDLIEHGWEELRPELEIAQSEAVDRVIASREYRSQDGRNGQAIIRTVKNIRRNRTGLQALAATGCVICGEDLAIRSLPAGQGEEEVELHYFRHDKQYLTHDELALEYEMRGLIPDPQAQIADNEAGTGLTNTGTNGTHWKNGQGDWCIIIFSQSGGTRCVIISSKWGFRWHGDWLCAGVRKPAATV